MGKYEHVRRQKDKKFRLKITKEWVCLKACKETDIAYMQ